MNVLITIYLLVVVAMVDQSSAAGCDQETLKSFAEKVIQLPTKTKLCDKAPGSKDQHYQLIQDTVPQLLDDKDFMGSVRKPDAKAMKSINKLSERIITCIKKETHATDNGNLCNEVNQKKAIACAEKERAAAMPLMAWIAPQCEAAVKQFHDNFDQTLMKQATEIINKME